MKATLPLFACLICCLQLHAQDSTEVSKKEGGLVVLPAIFYSPETSLGFGAAAIKYFRLGGDTTSRPSNINAYLIYTLENQVLISFPYNVFLSREKYWLKGELGYYIYPYEYYGVGSGIDLDTFERYDANFLRIETNALQKVRPNLYVGGTLFYDQYFSIKTRSGGRLESENVLGIKPNALLGIGLTAILDRRNNVFSPSKGYYVEGRVLQYEDELIGAYSFTDMYIDGRKYFQPADRWETALEIYHQTVLGNPPFYNLARLGGTNLMRGYYKGAYRDQHQTVVQGEQRRYLTKRIIASVFGGLGSVSDTFGDYDKVLGSYGIGLRYELNTAEHLRIRIDYARGANTSGFYININEAF